jgi:hypothetical protein
MLQLAATLTFFGLPTSLTTTFTYLGAILDINNRYLWINYKDHKQNSLCVIKMRSAWTDWDGRRGDPMGGDVHLSCAR